MRSNGQDRERELEEVANRLHRLHLERFCIYEKEKELLRELVAIRRRRDAERRRHQELEETERNSDTHIIGVGSEPSERVKRDCFGNELNVGDRVEFLTPGRLVGKIWKIYKIRDKRVLCERNNGVHKTQREFRNVKKIN